MNVNNFNKLKALKRVNRFIHKRIDKLTEENEKIKLELNSDYISLINSNGENTYQIHSPNTILTLSKKEHIINCVDNYEIIIVYKPNLTISRDKIIE